MHRASKPGFSSHSWLLLLCLLRCSGPGSWPPSPWFLLASATLVLPPHLLHPTFFCHHHTLLSSEARSSASLPGARPVASGHAHKAGGGGDSTCNMEKWCRVASQVRVTEVTWSQARVKSLVWLKLGLIACLKSQVPIPKKYCHNILHLKHSSQDLGRHIQSRRFKCYLLFLVFCSAYRHYSAAFKLAKECLRLPSNVKLWKVSLWALHEQKATPRSSTGSGGLCKCSYCSSRGWLFFMEMTLLEWQCLQKQNSHEFLWQQDIQLNKQSIVLRLDSVIIQFSQ